MGALNKDKIKYLSKIFISTDMVSKKISSWWSHDCSCCHLSHDAAVVRYDGSELAGRVMPRLCSRLEAGPASPAWLLRDSSRFVTRLRSKSSGWISSSSSVCPEPPCVGGLFADRWGGLLSKSGFLESCREKEKISFRPMDGWDTQNQQHRSKQRFIRGGRVNETSKQE